MYKFRLTRYLFYLFTKPPYMNVYRSDISEIFVSPDVIEQFFSAVNFIWIIHKEFEKVKLFYGQIYFFFINKYSSAVNVYFHISKHADRRIFLFFCFAFGTAAHDCFDTRLYFKNIERFGNIIEYGADDYMTKPFEIRELLMRIQAISRRSHHQDTSHPVVGNLSYDPATCEICNTQTKKSVQVSGKEIQLLEFFMNNCNQVLEKNQITTKIWGFDSNAEYNNVEVYVSFLRRKFHHLQVNVTLRAIRGVGYIMEVSDD